MGKYKLLDKKLSDLYYKPKNPTSFSSHRNLKREYKGKTDVKEWLSQQDASSLHKPIRYKFPRRQTLSGGIDYIWQIDLCDVNKISKFNNDHKYLLTVIDIFSKYAWVVPIKRKYSSHVIKAFEKVFKFGRVPNKIHSDRGGEFDNHAFKSYLSDKKITLYFTENYEIKASIVERFNRTLKNKIWKYFTAYSTKRYIDVLDDIVSSYNNSFHSSIKSTPDIVSQIKDPLKVQQVYERLYGKRRIVSVPFKEGDRVRISKLRKNFRKGYLPNWSKEIFVIHKVDVTNHPPTYILRDEENEILKGRFYSQELQKFDRKIFDKLLKRKKVKGKQKFLVKWETYDPEWVSSNIYYKNKA